MPLVTFKPLRIPEYRIRNHENLAKAMEKELERFGKDLRKDFEATVKKWDPKPTFRVALMVAGNTATYWVYTNDKRYLYVSGGAKKHREFPVNKKALKLALTKRVKLTLVSWKTVKAVKVPTTRTKWISVGVFSMFARHPGIKKRDYPGQIMRNRRPEFSKRLHAAIDEALKKK